MPYAKDSSTPNSNSNSKSSPTSHQQQQQQQQQQQHHRTPHFFMAQDILRILATLLSTASLLVMVTNNQTVLIFSIRFQAHFYYSPSFKFFVAANGAVAAFSLLTLILNFLLKHRASPTYHFFLFLHDIVMTVLLIAGCAAATAIGYVGQFGEEHVGWQPICEHVHKFCKTNLVSLLLSYFAFIAYFGLTILSAYKCVSSSPKN